MREIKFRAWDPSLKCMLTPSVIGEFGQYYFTDRDYEDGLSQKDGLMQYTGLKDKNGVEIYEGDVMKFFDKVVAVIVWDFNSWCFKWVDPTYIKIRQYNPEPVFRNINLFEVVGNIHQNPELLNP